MINLCVHQQMIKSIEIDINLILEGTKSVFSVERYHISSESHFFVVN